MSSMKRMRQRAIRRLMAETGLKYTDAVRELERRDRADAQVSRVQRSRAPQGIANLQAQIAMSALQRAAALPDLKRDLAPFMSAGQEAARALGTQNPAMSAVQKAINAMPMPASLNVVQEAARALGTQNPAMSAVQKAINAMPMPASLNVVQEAARTIASSPYSPVLDELIALREQTARLTDTITKVQPVYEPATKLAQTTPGVQGMHSRPDED